MITNLPPFKMVIVVSGTYFSLSEADSDEQRHIRLVPANTRASKPGRHLSRKTMVCRPFISHFLF
jgi:hypothetical protein